MPLRFRPLREYFKHIFPFNPFRIHDDDVKRVVKIWFMPYLFIYRVHVWLFIRLVIRPS